MSDNTTPRNDDETVGMKYTRWIVWFLIAASGVFFVIYTAWFQ